jgi:predicted amidohydrolase
MFDTGFTMNLNIVEEWGDNNSSLNFLKNLSENKNAAIYTSFATKENESYFNRGVFVFPDGNIEIYDKRKLFIPQSEDKYFTPGENEKIVNYKGWKINLQICNDLRFPELSINKNENNDIKYDILINVANWSSGGLLDWQTLLTARSIENQSYVIGVNRIGKDNNGFEYIGDTLVFNPLGESEDLINVSEYLWIFELDYIDLQRIRKFYPSESSEKN